MRLETSAALLGVAALLLASPTHAQSVAGAPAQSVAGAPAQSVAGASAQSVAEDGAEVALDTVVVQGGRGDPSAPAGTATTSRTDRRAIDNRSVNRIQDLGRTEEAGVSFNRTTNSVNIRGLEGSRVLTTIDGIRVPYLSDATRNAVGGGDSFDFNSLSSLDLTRGADPLLGSGALGGVLALRTLEPEDLLGGRMLGALTKNGYDSTDRSWFTSNAAAMRHGATTALLQGSYRIGNEIDTQGSVGGIGPRRTEPNPRDYENYSLLAKLYHEVEGGHRFGIVGEIFDREDDIDGQTTQTATGAYRAGNFFSGEELERRKVALSYDYLAAEQGTGVFDEATAILYYQGVDRATTVEAFRSTDPRGRFTRDNSYEEDAFGLNAYGGRHWQLGSLAQHVTIGTELRVADTVQYSAGFDGCLLNPRLRVCGNLHTNQADTPEVDSAAVGVYVQNETSLLDGRLRLTPGGRLDWYEETPKLTPEFEENPTFRGLPGASGDTAFSPKFLAEYDLTDSLAAYAQWSRAFRAPTVGELYSRFGAVGTYLRVGNENLDPERSNGFDAGLRYGDEIFGGQINAFTTRYRDFVDVVQLAPPGGLYPQGGISSFRNIPDARISGVEAAGHVLLRDHWRARASISYLEGRNLTDDTFLDSVSPLTAILGLGYEGFQWGSEISTKLAARRDKVEDGFEAPGYGVVDLTAWYEPERVPGLKLTGGVFNVLDKTFYDAVTVPESRSQPDLFYSEPGRAFKVNAIYKF